MMDPVYCTNAGKQKTRQRRVFLNSGARTRADAPGAHPNSACAGPAGVSLRKRRINRTVFDEESGLLHKCQKAKNQP